MAADELIVHGAREHNLKDITVRLPRNSLICITGLSGSGKSSLAFDTIYAEGQRRYVESLSAYARQFLQMMEKPDVDSIDGLSPAISIDQKTTSRNPRSTVGTVTEIYDYLRLLYARVGHPHCPICGKPIAGQSLENIVDQVLRLPEGTKFTVNAPVVRDRKGEFRDVLDEIRAEGFSRVKVDGEQRLLEEEIVLDKKFKHSIEVVVDRLVMKADLRTRLAQSVETAAALADGLVAVDVVDGEPMLFSEKFACPDHGVSLPELAAAHLLVQLAARRLPALHRPRLAAGDRPRPARPRRLRLARRRRARAVVGRRLGLLRVGDPGDRRALRDRHGDALGRAHRGAAEPVPVRHRRATRSTSSTETGWGAGARTCSPSRGSCRASQRRYRETDSSQQRERIEEYMSFRPCPACNGARLKPEVLAVTVGGKPINEFTTMSVTRSLEFLDALGLTETEELIGHRIVKEIRERLTFLDNVGVGYLHARPRGRDALGRRGAAAPARDPDRLAARRRPLHPRRAVDRAPPARQQPADRHPRAAQGPRQHRARGRARRADDARRRLARRHGARRGRPRRLRRRGGEGRRRDARTRRRSRASSSRASARSRCRSGARRIGAHSTSSARPSTT